MKPFFDAYFGPFKDKHSYWVGILLLIRVIVLLVFAIVQDPNISLVAVNIAAALILLCKTVIGDVYKRRCLSIWENSFFINLIILSLITLYIRASGENQAALVYTAVGITFAQFITIVFYHILMKREVRRVIQRWYLKLSPHRTLNRWQPDNEILHQQGRQVVVRQPTQSIIVLHKLREPLLTD